VFNKPCKKTFSFKARRGQKVQCWYLFRNLKYALPAREHANFHDGYITRVEKIGGLDYNDFTGDIKIEGNFSEECFIIEELRKRK